MNRKYFHILLVLLAFNFTSCVSPTSFKVKNGEQSPQKILYPLWEKILVKNIRFSDIPQQFQTPIIHNSLIYSGNSSGYVYCIGFKGKTLWKTNVFSSIQSTPLLVQNKNLLVIGTIGGKLFGLNAKTGKIKWKFKGFGGFLGTPTYKSGVIYASTSKNIVYAITADNGLLHWSKTHETVIGYTVKGHSSPVIDGNILYVGFSDGKIAAMNLNNRGSIVWSTNLNLVRKENYIDADSIPVVTTSRVYMASYRSGIFALDKNSGNILWKYPVYGVKNISVSKGKIYFISATKGIHCISTDGNLLWRQKINMGSAGQVLNIGKYLLIPFDEGGLFVLNSDSGYFYQRFSTGSGISGNLTHYKQYVAFVSNNGKLYFFKIK